MKIWDIHLVFQVFAINIKLNVLEKTSGFDLTSTGKLLKVFASKKLESKI